MPIQKLDGVAPSSAVAPEGFAVARAQSAPVDNAQPSAGQVRAAVNEANQTIQSVATDLEFEIDPDTKVTVVKLIDTSDHTVLRQVPAAEMLKIAKAIDQFQGALIHDKA